MQSKLAMTLSLLVAGIAVAGGFALSQQVQTGNGVNGMTYAVATGDGCALQSSAFGSPVQNYAKVSLRASSTNTFLNAADISFMRCQHYAQDPQAAISGTTNYAWLRCPQYDFEIDGGQSGKSVALNVNTLDYNVGPLPLGQVGERYTWTGEQIQQSGTLDAGLGVAVYCIAP